MPPSVASGPGPYGRSRSCDPAALRFADTPEGGSFATPLRVRGEAPGPLSSAAVPPTAQALRAAQRARCASPATRAGRSRTFAAPVSGPRLVTAAERRARVIVNLTACRYPLLHELAADLGWEEDDDETGELGRFNLWWTDTSVSSQRVARLNNWQRINHFPGMHLICKKHQLSETLGRLKRARRFVSGGEGDFLPRTWTLPAERSQLRTQVISGATFIVKPNSGCQGRGIFLTQAPYRDTLDLEDAVVQEYIESPLLMDGKKFDLRLYVLVTSVRHLSVHVFREGLVRVCTERYEPPSWANTDRACMHLTNYAINCQSENFVFNTDADQGGTGHKRDLQFFRSWLDQQDLDADRLWRRIDRVLIQTLLAAQPLLLAEYNSCFPHGNDGFGCFELLGFDLLIDSSLKPWLLEVNHSPSFRCDTPLDARIKGALIAETVAMLGLSADDRRNDFRRSRTEFLRRSSHDSLGTAQLSAEERARQRMGFEDKRAAEGAIGFRRLYPPVDSATRRALASYLDAAKVSASPATTLASAAAAAAGQEKRRLLSRAPGSAPRPAGPRPAGPRPVGAPQQQQQQQPPRSPRAEPTVPQVLSSAGRVTSHSPLPGGRQLARRALAPSAASAASPARRSHSCEWRGPSPGRTRHADPRPGGRSASRPPDQAWRGASPRRPAGPDGARRVQLFSRLGPTLQPP